MATVKRHQDRVELYLTVEEVTKAWTEKLDWFKSPVQVAADKGMQTLNIVGKASIVRSEWVEPGLKITYTYAVSSPLI